MIVKTKLQFSSRILAKHTQDRERLRAQYNINISNNKKKLKNLTYICSDIKDIK